MRACGRQVGQASWDVANFCVMSLESETLAQAEEGLLQHYYETLQAALQSQPGGGAAKLVCRRSTHLLLQPPTHDGRCICTPSSPSCCCCCTSCYQLIAL